MTFDFLFMARYSLIYIPYFALSDSFYPNQNRKKRNKMETHYVTLCRGPSVVEPISFLMHYVSLLSKAARKATSATPPRIPRDTRRFKGMVGKTLKRGEGKAFSISTEQKTSVTIPNVTLKI